jgi:hypothetical protein
VKPVGRGDAGDGVVQDIYVRVFSGRGGHNPTYRGEANVSNCIFLWVK